jgi:hypothetical protein
MTTDPLPQKATGIKGIWLAMAIWAMMLSVGASLYAPAISGTQVQTDWRRGMVLMVAIGIFLGGWMFLVLTAKPRPSRGVSDAELHIDATVNSNSVDKEQQCK